MDRHVRDKLSRVFKSMDEATEVTTLVLVLALFHGTHVHVSPKHQPRFPGSSSSLDIDS